MNKLLNEIFSSRTYITSRGEQIEIHSETGKSQCEFMQKIISDNGFKKSIELGFAQGISALAITEAVVKNRGKHLVIDKFENIHWQGVGLDLLSRAGYSEDLEFHEDYSYRALPKLIDQGRSFDFAYIDTTKQFDWLMVDFFLLDKLLQTGGVMVFDDCGFPGVRKLIRFVSQLESYRIYACFPENYKYSLKRKLFYLLRYLPGSRYYLKDEIVRTDRKLGVNTSCIAFQKTSEDARNYDWHKEF